MDRDIDPQSAYSHINEVIIPEVIELFKSKQRDYSGGPAFMFLGTKGQFSDLNRKFWKLYAAVWEGKELEHEQPDEIAADMIGHLLLLIFGLRVTFNVDVSVNDEHLPHYDQNGDKE